MGQRWRTSLLGFIGALGSGIPILVQPKLRRHVDLVDRNVFFRSYLNFSNRSMIIYNKEKLKIDNEDIFHYDQSVTELAEKNFSIFF